MFLPELRTIGTVYVIEVKTKNYTKVSQDTYTTLKAAQHFCRSRAGFTLQIDDYTFVTKGIVFKIYSTSLKGESS